MNPTTDKNGFQKLGHRAFYFFILERSVFTLILIILECVLVVLRVYDASSESAQAILRGYPAIGVWLDYALVILLFLIILVFLLTVLSSAISYIAFRYKVDENGFAVSRGIVGKEEISLPFRQIQNVDIDQPISYRIFGMCKLTILTAGHEDKDAPSQDESEIELPAFSLADGRALQKLLLDHANVQEVKTESAAN